MTDTPNSEQQNLPPPDLARIKALLDESLRWSGLDVSIEEISRENVDLVADLARFEPISAISMMASLLTLPDYQSNCIRLEILVALATVHCAGSKQSSVADLRRWFSSVGKSQCVSGEDPAEDVFVTRVSDGDRDYRLLEGTWESAGFYTQRILNLVWTMPDTGRLGQLKQSIRALLNLSDAVCERAGLVRYQLGSDARHRTLSPRGLPPQWHLRSRMRFDRAELDSMRLDLDDLEPFVLDPDSRSELRTQQIGQSRLDRQPLLLEAESSLIVALPTALSVAIRSRVIEVVLAEELGAKFDTRLEQEYSSLFFDTALFGGPRHTPVLWKEVEGGRIAECCLEVDTGYFLAYHFVLPSIQVNSAGSFKNPYRPRATVWKALQESVDSTVKAFTQQESFKAGQIVLVGCGWGKGLVAPLLRVIDSRWRTEYVSAADLIRLSGLRDMSPEFFWRVQDGLDAAERAGLHLFNINGLANLIGWIRSNDGHLIPHERLPDGRITPDAPLTVHPPLNLLRDVRAEVDQAYDRHTVRDNLGRPHDVERAVAFPYYKSASASRLYSSLDDVRDRVLTSVYEGHHALWVTVSAPDLDPGTKFHLWQMTNEWQHRIGSALDPHFSEIPGRVLNVDIVFAGRDEPNIQQPKPSIESLETLCVVEASNEPNACTVRFDEGFIEGFRIAENTAERLVVRTLVRAFALLLGSDDVNLLEALEAEIVRNDAARSFHIAQVHDFLDFVRASLPDKIVEVDIIDDAAERLGLGWRALDPDHSGEITGKPECEAFLHTVVSRLVDDIIGVLKQFNRSTTLHMLIANHERARTKEEHWHRTSAAVLGLHGDEPSTRARFVEQQSRYAGAAVVSRILVEMGLCECPLESGAEISRIELSKLIAKTALLVRIGGVSDAIHYNALKAEVRVSGLGDILFRNDFGELVVEPMLTRAIGERYVASASKQRANYDAPVIVPESKSKIDPVFWAAWLEEMGFDLDQARVMIEAIEDKGIQEKSPVLVQKKSEWVPMMLAAGVSEVAAQRFLNQFSLATRPQWDIPPQGFKAKEIYPWRFGRRLSLVSRPILVVDDSEDPSLMIPPGLLRRGFSYLVDGAYSGKLGQGFFHSHAMRNEWFGRSGEGHSFNAEVATALREAGWTVRENIGLPELLATKMPKDSGDVDVLAWRQNDESVLVIECKDLSFARNYSEAAALLSDFQGEIKNGKPDKLRKHIDRVAALIEDRSALARFTKISTPRVVAWIVFSGIVPMQYASIPALTTTRIGQLKELLLF